MTGSCQKTEAVARLETTNWQRQLPELKKKGADHFSRLSSSFCLFLICFLARVYDCCLNRRRAFVIFLIYLVFWQLIVRPVWLLMCFSNTEIFALLCWRFPLVLLSTAQCLWRWFWGRGSRRWFRWGFATSFSFWRLLAAAPFSISFTDLPILWDD